MHYDYFISMIKRLETSRVKAYQGQAQSASQSIPNAFALVLDNVIETVNKHLDELCKPYEGLVIFGLQLAGSSIKSSAPITQNRVIDANRPDNHFCCTLEYLIIRIDKMNQDMPWDQTHSIIIDFSTGAMMDKEYYLSLISRQETRAGKLFGYLNKAMLDIAWSIVHKQKRYQAFKPATSLHVVDKRSVGLV